MHILIFVNEYVIWKKEKNQTCLNIELDFIKDSKKSRAEHHERCPPLDFWMPFTVLSSATPDMFGFFFSLSFQAISGLDRSLIF